MLTTTPQTTIPVIGIDIDIGKNSFHIVGLDSRGAIVLRQKWSRGQVEARLANLPPCLIGMEAWSVRITSVASSRPSPNRSLNRAESEHTRLPAPRHDHGWEARRFLNATTNTEHTLADFAMEHRLPIQRTGGTSA